MKIILLGILFIIHWMFIFYTMFYIFFRKNKKYDYVYITVVTLLIAHWLFLGECIISCLEKYIMDNSYTCGKNPPINPSVSLYLNNTTVSNIIGITAQSFMLYNICILSVIYKVPTPIIIIMCLLFIGYILYWRIVAVIDTEIQEIKKMKIPEWIETSPYLKGIYERKINKPVSFTDVFHRLACYIVPQSCNSNQIDWNTFEKDCDILRKKININTYDYVVGIESGGAFVGRALRKDCKYIKISKYDDNYHAAIGYIFENIVITKRDDLSMIRGGKVLVVDDQMGTGQTITTARKYLLEVCGAKHVDRAILYSPNNIKLDIEFIGLPYFMSRSPWGYSA